MATGLVNSFLAAIQASLSVLLVISYGGLAAHLQLLTPTNTKAISKVCVRMFLPALLVTKIGGELHAGSAGRYLTVLVWAVACHLVSFLVGVMAHLWLGMPDWTTVAVMFNNTTSYPLLLIAALEQTGILKSLIPSDGGDHGETTSQAVERAKSYFLVFATVSSCLTFAVGPRLIDTEHAADSNDEDDDDEEEPEEDKTDIRDDDDDDDENQNNVDGLLYHHQSGGVGGVGVGSMSTSIVSSRGGSIGGGEDSTERTRLLSRRTSTFSLTKKRQNSFFPSTRTTSIIDWTDDDENSPQSQGQIDTDLLKRRPTMVPVPRRRWIKLTPRTRWWLLFISDFFNAPLLGAILGAFIGLIPPLHRAFFNDTEHGGIFTAWLTSSWQSIGGLFVPLPVVVAGVSLYTAMKEARKRRRKAGSTHDDHDHDDHDDHDDSDHSNGSLPWGTVTFIMVIRFIIWPAVSISVIYFLAKNTNILGNDPMLWFAMMLMPTGPPAMKLITLVQVSDADEADETNMAKLLTLSYAISPILSFTVVGGLRAAQAAT